MTIKAAVTLRDGASKIFQRMSGRAVEMADSSGQIAAQMDKAGAAAQGMEKPIERSRDAMDQFVETSRSAESPIERTRQATEKLPTWLRKAAQEQGRFNQRLHEGAGGANGLLSLVKKIGVAIGGIKGIQALTGLSDELVQTKTRLDMMNDGLQTTEDLQKMIFAAANRSRGAYQETAASISQMGTLGRDAFNNTAEVVAFMEQINKQFALARTPAEGISAAMLQLTQAMGSGVLRGEELNSVFEQASTIVQTIADYMDVPIGKIRALAQEGQLTASVVKNAMLWAAEETNAKFEQMPMTFAQIWTSVKNYALMAFQPILQKINEIGNSEAFQTFVQNVIGALIFLSEVATAAFDLLIQGANWVVDNWSLIAPIVMGVVAAIAAYNAILIIAKAIQIALVLVQYWWIAAIVVLALAFLAFTEQVVGAIWWLGALFNNIGLFLGNLWEAVKAIFHNIMAWFINLVAGIIEAIKAMANNAGVALGNAWKRIQMGFNSLVSSVISGIKRIIEWLNKIPLVNIDTGGLSDQILGYAEKNAKLYASLQEYEDVGAAWRDGRGSIDYKNIGEAFGTHDAFADGWGSGAYERGAEVGASLKAGIKDKLGIGKDGALDFGSGNAFQDKFGDFNLQFDPYGYDALADGIGDLSGQQAADAGKTQKALEKGNASGGKTAANTEKMADKLDMATEDFAYLRDLAEQRAINRFTLASMNVRMNNNNSIASGVDADGVVKKIVDQIYEVIDTGAEGAYA